MSINTYLKMTDLPTIDFDLKHEDFIVPREKTSLDAATDILNRAPHVIAYIESVLGERKRNYDERKAQIILDNKEKKQDEKKATITKDVLADHLLDEVNKAEVILTLWENARDSAKKFYDSRN